MKIYSPVYKYYDEKIDLYTEIYRFNNNYGVLCFMRGYKDKNAEWGWNLSVLKFLGDGKFDYMFDIKNDITNEIEITNIDDEEVFQILDAVNNFPYFDKSEYFKKVN